MIIERIKNIGKLISLVFVRQMVFLGKNLYHLKDSPFLTLKRLWKEKDKSQIFLLTMVVFSPAIIYTTVRVVWDRYKYGGLLTSVGMVFTVFFWIEIILLSFISFWVIKVWRSK